MKNRRTPIRRSLVSKRSKKAGLPPGSLVYVGERPEERPTITLTGYDEARSVEKTVTGIDELDTFLSTYKVTWINMSGLHDVKLIEQLGNRFHLHPLVMEDILNTTQRPKTEDLEDYLFIVVRALQLVNDESDVQSEQVSLVLGPNYLISFQESSTRLFDTIRERIKIGKGRLRKGGPDFLAYSLLDAIVDNYFVILEKLGDQIELLEEELVTQPKPDTLQTIHRLKIHMIYMRKSVWPLREVINRLVDEESHLIQSSTVPFLRDVYDHTIHAIDTMETSRDIISGMLDIYLSSVSYRINNVMKVLTVIATFFMPLTFLAGWYGMNFKSMPEYDWQYGYVMVICVAIAIVIGMLIFFKRKEWW
jgi:magnesium transporter